MSRRFAVNDALAPLGLIPCHVVNTHPADLRHGSRMYVGVHGDARLVQFLSRDVIYVILDCRI
jgi:hypothetical protein